MGTRQRSLPAFVFMAYAAAVILLGWYPWNVLLLALLQLTKKGERYLPDMASCMRFNSSAR